MRLRLILVLLASLAWVAAPVGLQLHFILVQHEVCDEHGDIVEIADDQGHGAPVHSGNGISVAERDHHDHGCSLAAPASESSEGPAPVGTVADTSGFADPPILVSQAPAGSPLAFAPKTSPPTFLA